MARPPVLGTGYFAGSSPASPTTGRLLSMTEVQCARCQKCFTRVAKDVNKARKKNRLQFCSKSCAAAHNNLGRIPSASHRTHTSASLKARDDKKRALHALPSANKTCPTCGTLFRRRSSTCSRTCARIPALTREDLLRGIQDLAEVAGGAPTNKMDASLTHAARRIFGSWNKAVSAAGLHPNVQWMRRKVIRCSDGHRADSLSERVVDDWFHERAVSHERHRRYPEGQFTCDFYLPTYDLWVEYFGMAGSHPSYDATIQKKRDIAARHGMTLVEVLPRDLFPTCNLSRVFHKYI